MYSMKYDLITVYNLNLTTAVEAIHWGTRALPFQLVALVTYVKYIKFWFNDWYLKKKREEWREKVR